MTSETAQAASNERLDIVPHFSFAASAQPLTDDEYAEMREYLKVLRERRAAEAEG